MNWSLIVWIIVIGLFIFYPIGLWEGRGRGYKKRQAEEAREKKENPPPPADPVTVKVDDSGLMRIKNENGLLTLDLDGVRVDTSAFTADQRKRLIEMVNVMRPWLESKPTPAPMMPPAPLPPQPTPATPIEPTPPSKPRIRPVSAPIPPKAKDERPSEPALGIVGQIDSVLQARLIGTPLEGRGIFLSSSPEGGVIVNVGLQKFNGIDEVTDPEVKAALRAAITEWENKYTPGL